MYRVAKPPITYSNDLNNVYVNDKRSSQEIYKRYFIIDQQIA